MAASVPQEAVVEESVEESSRTSPPGDTQQAVEVHACGSAVIGEQQTPVHDIANDATRSCSGTNELREPQNDLLPATQASPAGDPLEQSDFPTPATSSSQRSKPKVIPAPEAPPVISISVCSCGHALSETAKFCSTCGKSRRDSIAEVARSQLLTRRETIPPDTVVAPQMNSTVAESRRTIQSEVSLLAQPRSWTVQVERRDTEKLGMSINKGRLIVERVSPGGLIQCWNRDHPELAVNAGHRIRAVNGYTTAEDIFHSCTRDKTLEIKVEEEAKRRTMSMEEQDMKAMARSRQKQSVDASQEKTVEVSELQTLSIGPFQAGVACEFIDAEYGWQHKTVNVLEKIKELWEDNHTKGLTLSGYNRLFGIDPAPLRFKKLRLTYRLHNVREWDVSQANYTEGVGKLGMVLPIAGKLVTNVVGVTLAAGGYALGKAETGVRQVFSSPDACLADSSVFKWGYMSWLQCNGIFPTINYDDTGKAGLRLRRQQFPDEDPHRPAPKEDMRQTPIILCNHVSYIDGFVMAAVFNAPKILAMAGTKKTPIVGTFADEIGVIEVDRESKDSRAATLEAIQTHVAEWQPGQRPLLLFPEGTTSNGQDVLDFKKGAFLPGKPVRPAVLYYTGDWHPANTNFKTSATGSIEPTGDSDWAEQFLGHMVHSLQIRVLPPYIPTTDEEDNPELFASNVRTLMRQAYLKLKDECDAKKQLREEEGYVGMARRTLIDAPLNLVSNLYRNSVGQLMGESDDESYRGSSRRGDTDRRRSLSERRIPTSTREERRNRRASNRTSTG